MRINAKAAIVIALLVSMAPVASLALTPYSQDFEGLNQASGTALGGAGWLVFANVFGPDWGYWYGYGVYPAPNGSGAFSNVAVGEGGASQGNQQMVVFSDYNNANHADGAHIEALVFQERTIDAGAVGQTWVFDFDAKRGDLAGVTTAVAFIKTLNPAAGYATTNNFNLAMTAIPTSWSGYSLSITIDPSLVGQLLQFGFGSTATLYQPSGVLYDNIELHEMGAVAVEPSTWGNVKSMFR